MQQYRPDNYRGDGDDHLTSLAKDLVKVLKTTQKSFQYDTLRLDKSELVTLAEALVEFGEDIHNSIGIWKAYEQYNRGFFGVRLPFAPVVHAGHRITVDRVRHLLWVLYPELIPGLVLSPRHEDLEAMAETIQLLLTMAFASVPKGSGVKAFLDTPNELGGQVKCKLIWLGTKSYMFRLMCGNYLAEENDGQWDIGYVDDFICQACTGWSGLGAIDILAGVLDISAADRRNLRSWYERHASFYRIQNVEKEHIDALNVINDQPYRIRSDISDHPFRSGHLVFGSLVPWRGGWYWSGKQQQWDNTDEINLNHIRETMKRNNSQVICRFWKQYETQVRKQNEALYKAALAYRGKDLVTYLDGLAMAADWQKEMRQSWGSRSPEDVQDVIRRHGLTKGRPDMNIPPDLLQHKNGIGIYLHPVEGKEIMCEFRPLIAGMKRRGRNLTEEQQDAIQQFLTIDGISPAFVKRIIDEYGTESVQAVFRMPDNPPEYWLEYLMHRYKGGYYRKRYPSVSVIDGTNA